MRPDRVIVGEVRGAEVVDMLLALGSGHTGSWSTIHSASAGDTVDRLVALVLRHHHQWSPQAAHELVVSAIHAVVHMERTPAGRRTITDIVHLRETRAE
jgi:pilus assembly protein CpaF